MTRTELDELQYLMKTFTEVSKKILLKLSDMGVRISELEDENEALLRKPR